MYQNKMETSSPPLLYSFLPVTGQIILDLLPSHECGKNGLIDWVICEI